MSDYLGIILMALMLVTFVIGGFYIWKASHQKHVIERREWEEKEKLLLKGHDARNPTQD